jgi:hypothetical protein
MKDNIFIAVNVVSTFTGSCETHPGGEKVLPSTQPVIGMSFSFSAHLIMTSW